MLHAPDCIVVFCHFLQQNGMLRDEFVERLDAAIRLNQMYATPIVVNGGRTHGTPRSQGEAARKYLEEQGVPEEEIVSSSEGHDTLEEIRLACATMEERGWSHAMFVTNRLQSTQVHIALWRFGLEWEWCETPLHDHSLSYLLERLIALPLTLIDPRGTGPLFRLLRWSRRHLLGQHI
jgi:uncharacterized SAM-binding protein YcdF (DUF218 family)